MSEFKEFQGKNLDDAINNACDHFSLNRDKLEIEIVSGGSTGVFGLVGKKNARVKARPRFVEKKAYDESQNRRKDVKPPQKQQSAPKEQVEDVVAEDIVETAAEETAPDGVKDTEVQASSVVENSVDESTEETVIPEKSSDFGDKKEETVENRQSDDNDNSDESDDSDSYDDSEDDSEDGYVPERRNFMEGDPDEIAAAVREALELMIEPIIQGKPKLEIEVGEDRVNVLVDDEENSGLIIGREGQTLSALQYLCNRMVSKKLQTSVRVQIDTGDYRERQDEKLRQLAWHLADKANNTGRVQSTKPLSSYHRRVVHMALQEDKQVNTRSKGEGPMKRVLILPKRGRGGRPGGGGSYNNRDRSDSGSYNSRPNNRDRSDSGSYNSRPNNRDRSDSGSYNSRPNNRDRSDSGSYNSRPNNRDRSDSGSYNSRPNNRDRSDSGSYNSRPNNRDRSDSGSYNSRPNNRDRSDSGSYNSRPNNRGRSESGNYNTRPNNRYDNRRGSQAPRPTPVPRSNRSSDEDNFNNEFAPGGYHSENSYVGYDPNAVSSLYSNNTGGYNNSRYNNRNSEGRYNRNNQNDRNKNNQRGGQRSYNSRPDNRGDNSYSGEKRPFNNNKPDNEKNESSEGTEKNQSEKFNDSY